MTVATDMHRVLVNTTQEDSGGGIYISQIYLLVQYLIAVTQSGSKISAGYVQPMVEMYLIANKLPYRIVTKKAGVLVSGISFSNDAARDLADILGTGIIGSVEAAQRASKQFKTLFPNS